MALGAVEKALSHSRRFTLDQKLRPLKLLPADWLTDCDDGTVEFRLAHALAGRGLRQRLVYVRGNDWLENDDGITTWQEGSLVRNLVWLLQREEMEQEQQGIEPKPPSPPFASLTDIARWIEEGTDDERLEAIARGLSLVRLSGEYSIPEGLKWRTPAAYNLLALVHRRVINEEVTLPRVPELLPRLLAGDCLTATSLASRRLYSSGLRPAVQGMYEPPARTLRIAAALAFPISKGSTASLLKQVQRFSDDTIEDS
jgi:CRISPR-associated protein Csx17